METAVSSGCLPRASSQGSPKLTDTPRLSGSPPSPFVLKSCVSCLFSDFAEECWGHATPTRPRHLRVREPRWGAGRASRGPTPRRAESVCLGLGAGPGPCVRPNLTVLSSAGPRRPHCPVEKPGPRRRPGRWGQLRRGLVSSLRRLCRPPTRHLRVVGTSPTGDREPLRPVAATLSPSSLDPLGGRSGLRPDVLWSLCTGASHQRR